MPRTLRSESGVAMVTVLLVGAALTAVTSAAAFVTMQEFGATSADRNAAQALTYAEAGTERLLLEIKGGTITWNDMSLAGCDADHPLITRTGSIDLGTYTTTLEVYNRAAPVPADRFRPAACTTASTLPLGTQSFLITSTGEQPAARRVTRQVIDVKPLGLPLGAYAYERIDANGTVNMQNASMVTEGVVTNRDNIGFRGTDPYYRVRDFYGSRVSETTGAYRMPAAVHAKNAITYGPASKLVEHGAEPNCDSVKVNPKGTAGQQQWDGSGTAILASLTTSCTWAGSGEIDSDGNEGPILTPNTILPPTSQFTEEDRFRVAPLPRLTEQDYLTLKQSAKGNGLHCRVKLGTALECSEAGGAYTALPGVNQLDASNIDHPSIPRTFVIYIEFNNDGLDPFAKKVTWSGGTNIGPCSTTPANNRSAVIIVRYGSFDSSGSSSINGAMLVPEGLFESTGTFTLEGTIIVRRIVNLGTVTIRLSSCWLQNLPGPFLDVTPVSWSEVDR